MSKVGDRWSNSIINPRNWDSEAIAETLFTFSVVGIFGFIITFGVSWTIDKSTYRIYRNNLEDQSLEMDKVVANKFNLKNFNGIGYNLNIKDSEEDPIFQLNVFGSKEVEESDGITKQLTNIKMDITKECANALAEAIYNKSEFDKMKMTKDAETTTSLQIGVASEDFMSFQLYNLIKSYNLSKEVYKELEKAVINAYNMEELEVGEASSFGRAVAGKYVFVTPETIQGAETDTLIAPSHSEFINCGVIVTGVSQVYSDDEKDVSFFISIQHKQLKVENMSLKKQLLELKGQI